MNDEATRQRVRADNAEAELERLKNIVRKMLDAQKSRDGATYVKAKDLVKNISPGITAYLASTNHNRTANRGKIEPRIEPRKSPAISDGATLTSSSSRTMADGPWSCRTPTQRPPRPLSISQAPRQFRADTQYPSPHPHRLT